MTHVIRLLYRTALLASVTMAVGCMGMVHPPYTDADLTFDPELVGTWVDTTDTAEGWSIQVITHEDGAYVLVMTDEYGQSGRFIGHQFRLGQNVFMDIVPEPLHSPLDAYEDYFLPLRTLLLMKRDGPRLEVHSLNIDSLRQYLETHPSAVTYTVVNHVGEEDILLTALTNRLRLFLADYVRRPGIWNEEVGVLYRLSVPQ